MFDFIKNLFGSTKVDFKKLFTQGAKIIDVRTEAEFSNGHIKQSKNIPLQALTAELKNLDPKAVFITCCASGMRSASAKEILKQNGFEVYNGGSWNSLQKKLFS